MSRVQQDQVIDDDEGEACPLCIEEFDLSDRNFRPCPCGFQICQFCYNNIKNIHNGLCPGCRRPYDEKSIQWKVPSPEEMASYRENQAQQQKRKAAQRQKEAQKREADTLSRKHLAGIRVRQKNLVYVTGLRPSISEEQLVQALRTDQYFGQYGKIVKIVVSKAKDTSHAQQSVGVYITFARREDAATCIQAVDGMQNGDNKLRAQYGTTKYCSSYLRNETCHNRNCMFLHEPGEENESFTRQDLSSFNVISTQSPSQPSPSASQLSHSQNLPPQASQPIAAASQPMDRQDSREGNLSPVDSSDGSALPSSASWANKSVQSRRASQAASAATPSPHVSSAVPLPHVTEAQPRGTGEASKAATHADPAKPFATSARRGTARHAPAAIDRISSATLRQLLAVENLTFVFDESITDAREFELWRNYPPLFDAYAAAKRQIQRNQEEERQTREVDNQFALQALSAVDLDEGAEGGSTQLGGEPEERQEGGDQQQHAIQPPAQDGGSSFGLGHTLSPSNDNGRTLLPQQQQQYLLEQFKSTSPGAPNQASQGNQMLRSGSFARQSEGTGSAHARQASRFSFANDSASASASVKPVANPKLLSQQSSMMPPPQSSQFNTLSQHQNSGNQYYSSGVQGPPPGLKATGTPPVSGGGMFGQGHGFATAGLGYGANSGGRTTNDEMMRELLRNRGSSTGSGQMSDAGKREFMFSSFLQHSQTSTPAPTPGLLNFPHGPQPGAFQEHGPQKHKKKGKKHRHANTSSSGGGVVDVADPSILQARMHQAGAAGQGYYSAQGQDQASSAGPKTNIGGGGFFASFWNEGPVSPFARKEQGSRPLSVVIPPGLSAAWSPKSAQDPQWQSVFAEVPGLGEASKSAGARPSADRKGGIRTIEGFEPALPQPAERKVVAKAEIRISKQATKPFAQAFDDAAFPALPKAPPSSTSAKDSAKNPQSSETKLRERQSKQDSSDRRAGRGSAGPSAPKEPEPVTSWEDNRKRQQPGPLDISTATSTVTQATEPVSAAPASSTHDAHVQSGLERSVTPLSGSRPATPGGSLDTPLKRGSQPRTIRVLATPKGETPPPVSDQSPASAIAAGGRTTSPIGWPRSRKASNASLNLPGTPSSEKVSDNASMTTEPISRTNSPQPSKTVLATKQKVKVSQKKEKQERAKTGTEEKVEEPNQQILEEPVMQEPIIGRKKKAKKATNISTTVSTPTASRPTSPGPSHQERDVWTTENSTSGTSGKASDVDALKAEPEASPVVAESPSLPEPQKSLPFPASILLELQASGEINPSAIENSKFPGGPSYRNEVTVADLANLGPQLRLSDAEFALLDSGEPVRRGGQDGRISSRVMITPSRTCLRGLTRETEDRYLAIEQRVTSTRPPIKYTHRREVPTENSAAAAAASMADHVLKDAAAALARPPNTTANVVDPGKSYGDEALSYLNQFILPPLPARGRADEMSTPTIGSAIPRIYTTGDPTYSVYGADVNTVKLGSLGMDLSGVPAVKQALASAIGVVGVLGAEEAEQAVVTSRRECESLEKRLLGLIKKNKRLAFGSVQ